MFNLSRTITLATAASVLAGCAPSNPTGAVAPIAELAGRSAGPAQRCVSTQLTGSMRIAAPQVILYGSGRTIWVNRLASSCLGMTPRNTLIVEPFGAQYCRGDRVRSLEPLGQIPSPSCTLGDFVPYSR
jgi:hypothetical protein